MRLEMQKPTHAPRRRGERSGIAEESQEKTSLFFLCATPRSLRLCGGEFEVSCGLRASTQETREKQNLGGHATTLTCSARIGLQADAVQWARRMRLESPISPPTRSRERERGPRISLSRTRGRGPRITPSPARGRGAAHYSLSRVRERAGVRAVDQQSPSVSPRTLGANRGQGCFQAVRPRCLPPRLPAHLS